MTEDFEGIRTALRESGLRVTKSRIAVFTILEKGKASFLSPDEIYQRISKSKKLNCDRASVYRALKIFESINLVKASHFQGEATKYQFHHHTTGCEEGADQHEHYFKCLKCNSIQPIGDCFIEEKLNDLDSKGFKTFSHHLEILGRCPKCSKINPK